MKPAENPPTLRLERHVEATPDDVFAAWTDATRLTTWYAPVPGWIVTGAVVDARAGGGYSLSFGPPPDGNLYSEKGVYLVVDPPHRLRWRGEVSGDATEHTIIDVQFDATASGTTVTIVESGYRNAEVAAEHEAGWVYLLENLAELFVPH